MFYVAYWRPHWFNNSFYPPACCDFFILIIREFKNRESYSALLVTETAHNILTTVFLPQFHLTVTFNYMITST